MQQLRRRFMGDAGDHHKRMQLLWLPYGCAKLRILGKDVCCAFEALECRRFSSSTNIEEFKVEYRGLVHYQIWALSHQYRERNTQHTSKALTVR